MIFILVATILLGFSDTQRGDLLNHELESLMSFEKKRLKEFVGQPFVTVFFQADCRACKLLFKTIQKSQVPIKVVALGINNSRPVLKRELSKIQWDKTALIADDEFVKKLNVGSVTPTTVFWNRSGQHIEQMVGHSAKNWQRFLSISRGLALTAEPLSQAKHID